MTDMLVKLYELDINWEFIQEQERNGVIIRKPIGPEKTAVVRWVREHFSELWASETDVALSRTPVSAFIATSAQGLLGFACYDATTLGYFGPTGVEESRRGRGIGKALLLACLLDMKLKGYGYAVIGWAGPKDFYRKSVGAVEIPDSEPGIWKGMITS